MLQAFPVRAFLLDSSVSVNMEIISTKRGGKKLCLNGYTSMCTVINSLLKMLLNPKMKCHGVIMMKMICNQCFYQQSNLMSSIFFVQMFGY